MKTAYYRMANGELIEMAAEDNETIETLSYRPPRLLLMVDGAPSSTPKRCELCIYRENCWKYEANRASGRICDAYQPWE